MAQDAPHASAIERVVGAVDKGAPLVEAFREQGVPLPLQRKRSQRGPVLLMYTDLEADDVVTTACLLQHMGSTPPVVVFACDTKGKDAGTIFAKKLTMATAALGEEFAKELLVVSGEGLAPPPDAYASQRCNMEVAAERTLERASAGQGLDLLIAVIAPGWGNIAKLLAALRKRPDWEAVARRTEITMYSGSFNIRGMTKEDAAALAEMTQVTGCKLQDNAHFIWTRKDVLPELRDMPSLMPDLDKMLAKENPHLLAAWRTFGTEFYAHLVDPRHKNLWAKDTALTDEERAAFDAASALYDAGDVVGYCKGILQHDAIFQKVAHYKRGSVRCFATGMLDGPLCDCLVFLTRWVEMHAPQLITFDNGGTWDVDFEKGFTGIRQDGGLCPAVQPMIVADPPQKAAKTLANAVMDTLAVAISLSEQGQKAVRIHARLAEIDAEAARLLARLKMLQEDQALDAGAVNLAELAASFPEAE